MKLLEEQVTVYEVDTVELISSVPLFNSSVFFFFFLNGSSCKHDHIGKAQKKTLPAVSFLWWKVSIITSLSVAHKHKKASYENPASLNQENLSMRMNILYCEVLILENMKFLLLPYPKLESLLFHLILKDKWNTTNLTITYPMQHKFGHKAIAVIFWTLGL